MTALSCQAHQGWRLTPLEYWDALFAATGRTTIPVHPDLIYQFLPIIWLAPGHAGVEFKNLTYDDEVLESFRDVRKGTFRDQDSAIPFHHDPRDMTRIWFRHPDTDRVHEIGWRGRHLIDAPLVDVLVDRVNQRLLERGGNRVLKRRSIMLQIIDEIGELTSPQRKDESRAQLSAATIRWGQAQRDHAEVAEAHRAVELATAADVLRFPRPRQESHVDGSETGSAPEQVSEDEAWPDYRQML
jgi:putative transposase